MFSFAGTASFKMYPLSTCASDVIDKERSRHSGMTSEITDGQREVRTPGPNLTDFMMQLEDYTPTVREIVAILAQKIGTFCVAVGILVPKRRQEFQNTINNNYTKPVTI